MISRFIDYIAVEKKYSPRTVEAYRSDLYEFCEWLGTDADSFNPEKVSEEDVKEWIIHLMETGGNGKKNSPRSVKQKLSALHSYYRFLLRVGAVKKDITLRVQTPKLDKPLPVFFKPQEMRAATQWDDEADDKESMRDCLIIEMLYQTGMRQAELLNLKDDDIDTTQKQIRIFGKRRKQRIVPIGDALCRQIEEYKQSRDADIGTFFVQWKKGDNAVPLTKSKLYSIVRNRMGEVSTLKKHSPHVLRHTFATTMLNNGADIRSIQQLLGHASLAATQVYTHTTFEQIKNIYNKAHPRARQTPRE
ncbi:MAG: tyrosine-type recombinase/integrase [Paludibacteraceae bacterium]|nr:tyrosine-type recombinase/integrase [Paludibacteraceae bacterium]